MTIIRLRLDVLYYGYVVVDADEHEGDQPVAAFAPGDLEGAISFIRENVLREEADAEQSRVRAQHIMNGEGKVIGAAERFRAGADATIILDESA